MTRRLSPEQYQRVTWWALLSLAAIILTGAFVRLSGSGLGCSDWPTCEQNELVAEFSFNPMVEFVNRLITGLVSVAVILAVLGSLVRRPRRRDLTAWSLGLVAGVVAQVVLGAIVTKTDLDPRVVLGHFLLSMVLLANAVILHHRARLSDPAPSPPPPDRITPWSWVMVTATIVVMVLGTLVTGAGPHTGSLDEPIERLPLAITDIARVHSISAWMLLAVVIVVALRVARSGHQRDRRRIEIVLGLVMAQGAVGYLQYATDVPIGLVALHIVGVVALWWAVLEFHLRRGVRAAAETRPIDDRAEVST